MEMTCDITLVQEVIVTTAVLHNMARRNSDNLPLDVNIKINVNPQINERNENDITRRELIDYFRQLL